jgi:hypothetical protein
MLCLAGIAGSGAMLGLGLSKRDRAAAAMGAVFLILNIGWLVAR